ncbi:MAG TPA: metallothionein [Polyangia bacterium]|jgi:hypothetical protein
MKTCKHEGCDCPVPTDRINRGDLYCSEFCAGTQPSQAGGGDDCGCGHASCRHHGS